MIFCSTVNATDPTINSNNYNVTALSQTYCDINQGPDVYQDAIVYVGNANGGNVTNANNATYGIYGTDLDNGNVYWLFKDNITGVNINHPQTTSAIINGTEHHWLIFEMEKMYYLCNLYAMNLDDGSITLIHSQQDGMSPSVYNEFVVYQQHLPNDHRSIYIKNLLTGVESAVYPETDRTQFNPAIFGDKVVWQEETDYTSWYNIYVKNLTTGITSVVNPSNHKQEYPSIYGDKVVWDEQGNVIMKDLSSGIVTIISSDNNSWDPKIYGNYVVWEGVKNC